MPDITIIRTHFPECNTWKDVVLWIKRNLNLRTITVSHFWNDSTYKNSVWLSEIVTFFVRCGLDKKESYNLTVDLIKMGFLKTLDEVESPNQNWVIHFLI